MNLLGWIESYLKDRKQKVIINGIESSLLNFMPGYLKDLYFDLYFFLIFINDIVQDIGCSIKRFADDTSIYVIIEDPDTGAEIVNKTSTTCKFTNGLRIG